jgi:hypothetical protein
VPLRVGQEIQEVLRRGDCQLSYSPRRLRLARDCTSCEEESLKAIRFGIIILV